MTQLDGKQTSEAVRLSTQAKSLLEPLKDIGAIVLGFSGIFYVIGFVVTSTYLLGYGVNDFNLFQAHYVATGLIFLVLTTLTVYPLYFVWGYILRRTYTGSIKFWENLKTILIQSWENLKTILFGLAVKLIQILFRLLQLNISNFNRTSKRKEAVGAGVEVFKAGVGAGAEVFKAGVGAGSEMTGLIQKNIEHLSRNSTATVLVFVAFSLMVAIVLTLLANPGILSGQSQGFGTMLLETVQREASWFFACAALAFVAFVFRVVPSSRKIYQIPRPFWAVLGILLVILTLIPAYTQRIYPLIPPTLGGGKPVSVQLVSDSASALVLGELIPVQQTSTSEPVKSQPVDLLDENESAYFVLVNDSMTNLAHAVRVDKGLVKGMVYLQPKPY